MSTPDEPLVRLCSRQTCRRPAETTLTYVYADSTAVVGPLSVHAEPHAYDLCPFHAQRLTAPRGWEIVRLEGAEAEASAQEPAAGLPASPSPAADPSAGVIAGSERSTAEPPRPQGIRRFGRLGSVPAGAGRTSLPAVQDPPPAALGGLGDAVGVVSGAESSLSDEIFAEPGPEAVVARGSASGQPAAMRRAHLRRPRRGRSDA